MINLIAFITTVPGRRNEVLGIMRENLPRVLAEAGCIEYRPTTDYPNASRIQTEAGAETIVVIEKWRDREALRAHMNAPHMVDYATKVGDLIAQRQIYILTEDDTSSGR